MTPRPIEYCFWIVPGRLLAGEYPRDKEQELSGEKIKKLREQGINRYLDLTHPDDRLEPYEHLLRKREERLSFPIVDVSVPESPRLTKAILDAIDYQLALGNKIYLHCWGGVGRTGTIAGCWLARHGVGREDAFKTLQDLWQSNPKSKYRHCPETTEQKQYIIAWREPECKDVQSSPLNVKGVELNFSREEIISAVREGRENRD